MHTKRKTLFPLIGLLAVLMSACTSQPLPEPTATQTQARNATNTPEPTSTPVPQTATVELREGWPYEWIEPIFELILEVEPEVHLDKGACASNPSEQCFYDVHFCPRGEECNQVIIMANVVSENETYLAEINQVPEAVFGGEYRGVIYWANMKSEALLLSEEEKLVFYCQIDSPPPEPIYWPVAAWEITKASAIHLIEATGFVELPTNWIVGDLENC